MSNTLFPATCAGGDIKQVIFETGCNDCVVWRMC